MESHRQPPQATEQHTDTIFSEIERLRLKLPLELRDHVIVNRPVKRKASPAEDKPSVLVAASPSPKKRRPDGPRPLALEAMVRTSKAAPGYRNGLNAKPVPKVEFVVPVVPQSKLESATTAIYTKTERTDAVEKLSGTPGSSSKVKRDETLAVIEDLELGPIEHDAPYDDPKWDKVEPYSRINLVSRQLPHEDLQQFLSGRYYVSPSLLYSLIRPDKHRSGFDVAVDGDWVTIAVVAERGKVLVTQGGSKQDDDDDDEMLGDADADPNKSKDSWKNKREKKPIRTGNSGKKYVRIKLVDFGHRSKSGSSAGDALLELMLFEADSISPAPQDINGKRLGSPLYKGGSGGAFEEMLPKLCEKAVVAILNPRVMRPFQGKNTAGSTKPHPTANILGITPVAAASIMIIGQSKDLGMCNARRKNGELCGSWCDKRKTEVCEYHLMTKVKSVRANRAEFSASTSGMSVGAPPTKRHSNTKFDAVKKQGLLPSSATGSRGARSDGAGATYIMSGHAVKASDSLHVSTTKQKDLEAKARKVQEDRENREEELLKKLIQNDSGTMGAKVVGAAREFVRQKERQDKKKQAQLEGGKGDVKGKGKAIEEDSEEEENEEAKKEAARIRRIKLNAWGPEDIKKIGYDPTIRPGDQLKTKKVDISAFQNQNPKRDIRLSPGPGPRIKSGVVVPEDKKIKHLDGPTPIVSATNWEPDDGSDSELEIESPPPTMKEDSPDLEIEPPTPNES